MMNRGDICNDDQNNIGCTTVDAWPVIWQSQFDGDLICGVPGGDAFVDVQRPEESTGSCPEYYAPCVSNTPANETLCYLEYELNDKCPITEILVVDNSEVPSYIVMPMMSYDYIQFNETASVVFTKKAPQLPPTTIRVEAEPCMDPAEQSASPS